MPSLRQDEAVTRAALLDVHAYAIDLDLTGRSNDFGSTVTITFECRRPGADTFVELRPVALESATLNGVVLDPAGLVDNRLPLTGLAAQNALTIRAHMAYSNSGEGLHRFVDPEDGEVYLYAQSFLDDAQRIFACFDQPDLKARFRLAVDAPDGWEVASNAAGHQTDPGHWEFGLTERMPPYLVTLIGGAYHVVRDPHDGVPMALYCRRGLAPHLDKAAAEIFEVARATMDHYGRLFDVPYPFGKYDQAFVPEFNAGAMENAGLVTFRDEFVFRSATTDSDRTVRARGISHEMAHMWFGNLVTLRWWDDLWLNESFAEYAGHRCLVEATRFRNAWTDFAVQRKGWGYADDQRPSTHPVAPESIVDAGEALLNFDGISYAKGASVLRQLAVWIGDDAFLAGLRSYIAGHAFANATLPDLLAALSVASGQNVDDWARAWLREPQVNTLRPHVVLHPDGTFADVVVEQSAPPEYPTLRPHRLGVGVYAGGQLAQRVEVVLDPTVDNGRTSVAALTGQPAGDLLLLNDGDLTYAKIRLDPASRAALPETLPRLADPLARALIWAAMSDAVRDAEVPAGEFVALCAAALPGESAVAIYRDVMLFASQSAVSRFLPEAQQPAAWAMLVTANRSAMDAAAPGSGEQLVAARGLVASAGLGEVEELRGWLDGMAAPVGLQIDAELRWTVLLRLCALGAATDFDIEAEYGRDHTAAGFEHAARCRAACPDPDAKATAWQIIVADEQLSNRLVIAAAEGFWQAGQARLTQRYVPRFFAETPEMGRRRNPMVVLKVAESAYPRYAVEQSTVDMSEQMVATPGLPAMLHRSVVNSTDDLRRALAARTLAEVGADARRP
jgi:aminopeptidase N